MVITQHLTLYLFRSIEGLVSLRTWHCPVFELKHRNIWPGVETLTNNGKGSAFFLGPLVDLGNSHFSLFCYDAAGKWEKVYSIKYSKIFRIVFDSSYCNQFNKYLKAYNKPFKQH
jgi:hypothetical protein